MDCSLKTPPYFEEFEQEPNSNIGFEQEPISGSSSLGGPGHKGDFSLDLKLGHVVFGNESVDNLPPKVASGSSKRGRASEQLNLAMAEKAYVEEARSQAKKQMELAHLESANAERITQQVQAEVENAKRIRQQAQSAVENAQVFKEQATKKISSTILQITCHSCKQQFQATTGFAAATAPVDNLPPTMASGLSQRARAVSNEIQAASCQVDGCQADLSGCTEYYRRHKVCRRHSKTPEVEIRGHKQRLCRQCRRFHPLEEFVEGKRSCRRRLAAHNERRRKPQPESLSRAGNLLSNYQGTEEATALEASRVMEASKVTKEEESEELKLAMAKKAYAEEARRQAKKQMELAHLELANAQRIMQQAQDEFENAKGIRQQAQAEVENAQVLKEQATKKISSTILQITCHSCKRQFQATTGSAAATAPVDENSRREPQPEPFSLLKY
ncbi:hypothetical protein Vadar_019589 [Vaccinium darrowii]|uniref:Uncharacterized protein n=1 Tax=Vaccinium darrowii TaxID=229202 RepID=A0ACB7Y0A3_9ERIC|nr:hypothetical protein Vadar_019589 [Vaccinium darrowii]